MLPPANGSKRQVPAIMRRRACKKCRIRFTTHENCPTILKQPAKH
jgi:transcriptional regulator NrdR family protein